MKRLLAPLIIASLSFCCAPSTTQTPKPDSDPQTTWRDDTPRQDGRYARPPTDESPSQTWTAEARRDPAPPAKEPSTAQPTPYPAQAPAATADAESAPKADKKSADGYAGDDLGRGRDSGGVARSESARPIPKPQPEDRPGLGTTWGETRYSSVSEVPFERDSARPTYLATLHYNDARGASSLAGYGYASNAAVSLGSALTVTLRNEYGSTLSAYRGNGRTVAVGENGQRYSIAVQNHTNERFEVVLSVDGLDVLDGRDAGYNKRGYLIEPYATIEIEGFRQSEDAVAAFRFGSVRDSYAARTGSGRNVGVIGAAAFGERGYYARLRAFQERQQYVQRVSYEDNRRKDADPFPTKYATPPLHYAR